MTPRFFIEATGEVVMPLPNGVLQFWRGDRLINEITFSGETAAVEYAKAKGWKEIQPV